MGDVDQYAVKAQTSLAPLSRFRGSRFTTALAHQCCRFQSYAKTVPSRLELIMKLTMREPAFIKSMTTDTWSRFMTSDFNSVFQALVGNLAFPLAYWYWWGYMYTWVVNPENNKWWHRLYPRVPSRNYVILFQLFILYFRTETGL